MDSLLSALGKLLGVFTEPVQVVLLLVVFALAFALYKVAMFLASRWEDSIKAQQGMAESLRGLTELIKGLQK